MSNKSGRYFLFWLIWAALIVYGSLLPFEWRPYTLAEAIEKFRHIPYLNLSVISRADWIANILLYVPLAYLGAMWLNQIRWLPRFLVLIIVILLGASLAVGVEFTQIFFAPRTVSINDLIAESIGTLLGLTLWTMSHSRLAGLATAVFLPGHTALNAGLTLYALAYLGLSLFPYDFVLSMSELQWKLLQNTYGWGFNSCGSTVRCGGQWLAETVAALPLGILLIHILNRRQLRPLSGFLIGIGVGVGIEAAQFMVASGVSTVSAALAKAVGIGLGICLRDPPSPRLAQHHAHWLRPALCLAVLPYLAAAALVNSWADASWGNMEILRQNLATQRYLPFFYHYFSTETQAVASLISQAAVYFPIGIGFWLWHASSNTPLRRPPLFGLILATTTVAFIIESGKLFLASSHPDFTNVLIAVGAAWLGQTLVQWLAECVRATTTSDKVNAHSHSTGLTHIPRKALIAISLTIICLGAIGLTLIQQSADSEAVVIAQVKRGYPTPAELPPADLPNFRLQHPRLPAPSNTDILRLLRENPGFIETQRKRAKSGNGKLDAALLMAYLEPENQNLDVIFKRLLALKFNWRGHEQGKLLAQGYDWLYAYWSETQRQQLRDKLVHGCNYLIDVIRSGKFSPYNATLYGGPAQALMACSIALYQDDPRGDPVMAFSADLWLNRILPVWRQVMGRNGGWHEGANITSAGIGQAIFQLPNIWRSATGEDYFASESGIRGFLDFLVYRTRPDGYQIRMGDTSAVNRDAPDRLALALEYRHSPAFSLQAPPNKPVPTSWPWGPLTDNSLYDPAVFALLPLTRHFDGIGLVVMRSDWTSDASYITFKAGDNFSSFTHLDQGSFTIFKNGPLAIDSGLYYKYGSDHHLNYAYQTIAHNVATITNPAETGAVSNSEFDKTSRSIANDGGQRRIGGDIEIYPHPLDVEEWQAKRELYHSGAITRFTDEDDLVIISADITAAYTNRFSGEGTLSTRSLRVRRYLRTLIYDRDNDLLLIYDKIDKTDPGFISRWLIHFPRQPLQASPRQFMINQTDSASEPVDGLLEGMVLLPASTNTTAVGGPGKEFWIDGRNYDNNGDIYNVLTRDKRKQIEAGAWRLEISPTTESASDNFLVALNLAHNWADVTPQVQCSQVSLLIRCNIHGTRERALEITDDGQVTPLN